MDNTSSRIVDFAISARDASFSASAVDACKRSLVDTFACALGAFDTPLAHKARHTAGRYKGGQPAAQVWGCDWTASVEMAAYANGVMLRLLDLSDAYRKKCGGHPSDVVAAIAAAADACNSSGAEVIAATIAAYEIYCACCDAVDLNALGWDQPVYGVVASAMGAGMLFGLGREQMGQALSLALAPNLALLQTRRGSLSNWKNCAGANAARNGMFAVLLAREGYTGPEEVFEGPHGLFEITGPSIGTCRRSPVSRTASRGSTSRISHCATTDKLPPGRRNGCSVWSGRIRSKVSTWRRISNRSMKWRVNH